MKKIDNSVCLKDFGEWIKGERCRRELTQAEVATMAEISQSQYCRIESAEREVDLMSAIRICNALRLDLSDFIKTHI